jgi:hypothetical protein
MHCSMHYACKWKRSKVRKREREKIETGYYTPTNKYKLLYANWVTSKKNIAENCVGIL